MGQETKESALPERSPVQVGVEPDLHAWCVLGVWWHGEPQGLVRSLQYVDGFEALPFEVDTAKGDHYHHICFRWLDMRFAESGLGLLGLVERL